MLFIAMCTFILNDINDFEVDKVNHPDRPLPSGQLLLSIATIFYFFCLALALFSTKLLVPGNSASMYYFFLVLVINYKYIVEQLPNCKSLYVSCASAFPVLIVASLLKDTRGLYLVALATSLFVWGREILLDFLDRDGDRTSFIHSTPRSHLTALAFTSQAAGLLLLTPLAQGIFGTLILSLVIALTPISLWLWLASETPRRSILIMKAQMYGGLFFLLQ